MAINFKATVYCDEPDCRANQTVVFSTNSYMKLAEQFWKLRWDFRQGSKYALCPVHSGGTKF